MTLSIITLPHPALKTVSKPIERVDDVIVAQMDAMLNAMYTAPGIGLAANQVNCLNRVIVMDIDWKKDGSKKNPIRMANPEIVWQSEERAVMEEGCLSIPGQLAEVERPEAVRVRYLDHTGELQEIMADGLLATCVQHEIDHLDGILFIDHLSTLKRNMLLRKYKKAQKDALEL